MGDPVPKQVRQGWGTLGSSWALRLSLKWQEPACEQERAEARLQEGAVTGATFAGAQAAPEMG